MSITVLQKEDFEADDILATLATQGAEQGFDVLVCSGDRDTIQLVNETSPCCTRTCRVSRSSSATTPPP
jgi:5'-3' exonuclease